MMRFKNLVAVVVIGATLNIGAGAALAAPAEVNCQGVRPVPATVVAVNCSALDNTRLESAQVDTRQPHISFWPEVSRGITIRPVLDQLRQDVQDLINWAAQKVGLSPGLLGAVARAESGGNHQTVSSAGAVGVMQLMPDTAASLGVNPYDPVQNILGGAEYLKQQIDHYHDLPKALAAYNAGPGNVDKYGGIPPFKETQNYIATVLANMNK